MIMNNKYNVHWSKTVRIITIACLILIIGGEIILIRYLLSLSDWIPAIFTFLIPLIMGYFILIAPMSIEIDGSRLVLIKFLGKKIIKLEDIDKIEAYISEGFEMRLFGSGGFYGFVGTFRNSKIGKYQSYVGDYSQTFFVETKKHKKYMLSCNDHESLISKINEIRSNN